MAKEIKIMGSDIILIYDAPCQSVYQNTACAYTRQFTFHIFGENEIR